MTPHIAVYMCVYIRICVRAYVCACMSVREGSRNPVSIFTGILTGHRTFKDIQGRRKRREKRNIFYTGKVTCLAFCWQGGRRKGGREKRSEEGKEEETKGCYLCEGGKHSQARPQIMNLNNEVFA